MQKHFASVFGGTLPAYKTSRLQAVYQFYRAVVLDLQPLRQLGDPRPDVGGQSFEREQQLVLLRFQPGSSRGLFTEPNKPTDQVPEFSQRVVIAVGKFSFHNRLLVSEKH